jgi:plastocyanin
MKHDIQRRALVALAIGIAFGSGACGKESKPAGGGAPATEEKHEATEHAGKTIVVDAYSDATGNYFKPNEIVAKKGDIIRFTLKMGVHNVHFLPDSNPGKKGLPPASDMLQLPDQTYDLPVTFEEGRYYFQCDPHALLGMKGHLTVKD